MTALRQISLIDAAIYIVAQLAGAVAGALLTKALLLDEGKAVNYGAPAVSVAARRRRSCPGWSSEGLGTFFLVWVIVGVAVNPRAAKEWAALAIGAALGMGVMVFGAAHRRQLQPGPRLRPGARLRRVGRSRHLPARLRRSRP